MLVVVTLTGACCGVGVGSLGLLWVQVSGGCLRGGGLGWRYRGGIGGGGHRGGHRGGHDEGRGLRCGDEGSSSAEWLWEEVVARVLQRKSILIPGEVKMDDAMGS